MRLRLTRAGAVCACIVCCAAIAARTVPAAAAKPPVTQAELTSIEQDVNIAITDERQALLDLVKHPSRAADLIFSARSHLGIAVRDLDLVDLGESSDPTGDLTAAEKLDTQAFNEADARKGKKALPFLREALAKKKAALRVLEQVTVTPPSTGNSSLEACAIQTSPSQDEVKVGGPVGTTGSVVFSVGSATPQARTFILNATAPVVFVGPFVAPTAGFATITVQVSSTERVTFTFPANSPPASDCTLHP